MEEAEHEFLRANEWSVVMDDADGYYGFPKMEVGCNYLRPVRLEKWLDIQLEIDSTDGKTIDYSCTFHSEEKLVARGHIKVACCRFPADGSNPFPIPIPDHIMSILGAGSLGGEC